jgi:uncharacterized protein with HEPN domain
MKKNKGDLFHIINIKEMINEIEAFKKEGFPSLIFEKATRMNLALIGESVKKLSPELLQKYPQISWQDVISVRNRIIHDYSGLDAEVIDEILDHRLEELKQVIEKMLTDLDGVNHG